MNIYTKEPRLLRLLEKEEVRQLLAYFESLDAPVILREIKKEFSAYLHLDKNLATLIDHGILIREDRRYFLAVEPLTGYPDTKAVQLICEQLLHDHEREQLLVCLSENYFSQAPEKLLATDFSLPTRTLVENDEYRLVTLNKAQPLEETLPNYFFSTQHPESFPSLASLIGDVDPIFFMNQLGLIFERLEQHRGPRRETIFSNSLLLSHTATDQPEWALMVPLYESEMVSADQTVSDVLSALDFLETHQLLNELLGKDQSFTYLLKKKA